MIKRSTKVIKSFRMDLNLDNLTYLILCTAKVPTSCEVKYDIFGQQLINNRFKQPCHAIRENINGLSSHHTRHIIEYTEKSV